jgi:hypothetical protein
MISIPSLRSMESCRQIDHSFSLLIAAFSKKAMPTETHRQRVGPSFRS